ncbi:MAG: glutaredoxin 3 [Granulosicoccus sp.]|nr:glutaredoxin 3 [Granulosicoccus sp.]
MYESNWCGYCRAAKRLLSQKGWEYESRVVDGNSELRQEMQQLSGRTSVPQIFFGKQHIGGFDDMAALEEEGELEELYNSAT